MQRGRVLGIPPRVSLQLQLVEPALQKLNAIAALHLLRLWLTAHEHWSDGDTFLQQGIPKKDGVSSDAAPLHAESNRGSHTS